jgi:imidazolonepropionase-like amidohydrolase
MYSGFPDSMNLQGKIRRLQVLASVIGEKEILVRGGQIMLQPIVRRSLWFLTGLFLVTSGIVPEHAVAQKPSITAFVHVNVIPMDTERVLNNQTVIVNGDRIIALGPMDEVAVPLGAEIIEGNGAYLMPGLADMHTHLAGRDRDPGHLVLYLAQGTTTVRSLGEVPNTLPWREQVKRGDLIGPTIYSSGQIIVGNYDDYTGFGLHMTLFRIIIFLLPLMVGMIVYLAWRRIRSRSVVLFGVPSLLVIGLVLTLLKIPPFMVTAPYLFPEYPHAFLAESPGQAAKEVQAQNRQKVDMVKLYDGLTEEMFLAALSEAKKLDMYVVSHLPEQISLETLLTSGIDEAAHIDEFNMYHWDMTIEEGKTAFMEGKAPELDYSLIPRTVEMVKNNNIAVVSNMSTDEIAYKLVFDTPGVLSGPEYGVVRPEVIEYWSTQGRPVTSFADQGPYRKKEMEFFKALAKALHDAGVIMITGTDTAILVEGTLPEHIHRELGLLVEAGFSNYTALEAGTKNAGYIVDKMGRDGNFGTVAVGKRADLLLLKKNPLENVSHTRDRIGVMARGHWYSQEELDKKVEEYIRTY